MESMRAGLNRFMTRLFTRPSITWQQSFAIILPLLAEHLFNTMFGLLNTGMISSSGATSLSAVSLVDTLNSFLFVFYTGIATGASVIVANYRGRGDEKRLHEASVQAVTSVTLFTIVTMVFIILFNGPLLKLLFGQAEKEVMDKARLYMLGGALTLPFVGAYTSVCGVLRGIGYAVMPMLVSIFGVCGIRIGWIFTVFAYFKTIPSLYLLYAFSWGITAILETVYFVRCYKKLKVNPVEKTLLS